MWKFLSKSFWKFLAPVPAEEGGAVFPVDLGERVVRQESFVEHVTAEANPIDAFVTMEGIEHLVRRA